MNVTDAMVLQAVAAHDNKAAAARALGLPRTTLRRRFDQIISHTHEERRIKGSTQLKLNEHVTVKIPDDIDLYLASDLHCGSESSYYKGIENLVAEVAANDKARLILGGDQMEIQPLNYQDCGRTSDSFIDMQIVKTTKGLTPVADKLLMIASGNHGKARLAAVGIDPDLLVASQLNVPYATVPKVIVLKPGRKKAIKVCVGHGASGGMGDGMPELRRFQNVFPGCDIYALGHNHRLYAQDFGALTVDDTGKERWHPSWLCRTGSYLLYAEYARYKMYQPQPVGHLIARIRDGILEDVDVIKIKVVGK